MAEKSFYINDSDRADLFDFIKSNKGIFIPNRSYKTNNYTCIEKSSELLHSIENITVRYFIISEFFTYEPIILEQNEFLSETAFSIIQRKGGPYINLAFYRGFAEDANVKYKRMDIHFYPYYIHHNSHEEFQATPNLKEYYNIIVDFLKKRTQIKTINGKKYSIGNNIINELPA